MKSLRLMHAIITVIHAQLFFSVSVAIIMEKQRYSMGALNKSG